MKIQFMTLLAMLSPALLLADEVVLQTDEIQNTLVELYTSEGCSSCPPAEKFLNNFKTKTTTWQNIIPIAFHVDYWDYIGWKDRFAQPAFGKRQRQYAKLQRRSTVYTPAFFVNGQNWRPSFFYKDLPRSSGRNVGKLKVRIKDNTLNASYSPINTINEPLLLNVALLGMGLRTEIKAGENKGRLAAHEFVVLNHQVFTGKNKRWDTYWQATKREHAQQYAVAVWVSTSSNPVPLQAAGNYLPAGFIK